MFIFTISLLNNGNCRVTRSTTAGDVTAPVVLRRADLEDYFKGSVLVIRGTLADAWRDSGLFWHCRNLCRRVTGKSSVQKRPQAPVAEKPLQPRSAPLGGGARELFDITGILELLPRVVSGEIRDAMRDRKR